MPVPVPQSRSPSSNGQFSIGSERAIHHETLHKCQFPHPCDASPRVPCSSHGLRAIETRLVDQPCRGSFCDGRRLVTEGRGQSLARVVTGPYVYGLLHPSRVGPNRPKMMKTETGDRIESRASRRIERTASSSIRHVRRLERSVVGCGRWVSRAGAPLLAAF